MHIILKKSSIFCKKKILLALLNFSKWFILLKFSDLYPNRNLDLLMLSNLMWDTLNHTIWPCRSHSIIARTFSVSHFEKSILPQISHIRNLHISQMSLNVQCPFVMGENWYPSKALPDPPPWMQVTILFHLKFTYIFVKLFY